MNVGDHASLSLYLGQKLKFAAPANVGDPVTAKAIMNEKRILKLQTTVNQAIGCSCYRWKCFNQENWQVVPHFRIIRGSARREPDFFQKKSGSRHFFLELSLTIAWEFRCSKLEGESARIPGQD